MSLVWIVSSEFVKSSNLSHVVVAEKDGQLWAKQVNENAGYLKLAKLQELVMYGVAEAKTCNRL